MCDANSTGEYCGLGGLCADGLCVCSEGWVKTREFLFFVKPEQTDPFYCDTHIATLRFTYILWLVFIFFGIVIYARSVTKRSQMKRLMPFWVVGLLQLTLAVVKLADPLRELCVDLFLSTLLYMSLFISTLAAHIFFNKYIIYHYNTMQVKDASLIKKIRQVEFFGKGAIALMCLILIMYLLIPIIDAASDEDLSSFIPSDTTTEENQEAAVVRFNKNTIEREQARFTIMRISVLLSGCISVYRLYATCILLPHIKRDCRQIEKYPGQMKRTIRAFSLITYVTSAGYLLNLVASLIAFSSQAGYAQSRLFFSSFLSYILDAHNCFCLG